MINLCACCNYPDSDLRLVGCGCLLHTRCTPLWLVLQHQSYHNGKMVGNVATSSSSSSADHLTLSANTSPTVHCHFCGHSLTQAGITVLPLSFEVLEQSIALRTEGANGGCAAWTATTGTAATAKVQAAGDNPKKRGRDDSMGSDDSNNIISSRTSSSMASSDNGQASYITYCQGRKTIANGLVSDDALHRTGRWNDEEVEFVDQLVSLFDQGLMPLSNGTRLSLFLGDILLCKASRLTKKMKNARLSTRAFTLSLVATSTPTASSFQQQATLLERQKTECRELSALQEQFIQSLPTKSAQLELRFNVAKQWRSYFSNMCLEAEYPHLDIDGWIASLDELERRASDAEAQLRNVRRRRMGLGGSGTVESSPFLNFSSRKTVSPTVPRPISTQSMSAVAALAENAAAAAAAYSSRSSPGVFQVGQSTGMGGGGTFTEGPSPNDPSNQALLCKPTPSQFSMDNSKPSTGMMGNDVENAMMFLIGEEINDFGVSPAVVAAGPTPAERRDWPLRENSFLEAVSSYLEERNLPFQCAEIWVPSFAHNSDGTSNTDQTHDDDGQVRLLPAGFVTRRDQDCTLTSALRAFGEYSEPYSFKPGSGLPGRVYNSGKCVWLSNINEAPTSVFVRASAAKMYGLKTAAAIPFAAAGVGRMVVVMYSTSDLAENMSLAEQCSVELSRYSPQPKWKLVIDIGYTDEDRKINSSVSVNEGSKAGDSTTQNGSPPAASSDEALEKRLISLLGDQMPASHTVCSRQSTSSPDSDIQDLLPGIMRMRLLLLRSTTKRSQEDNDAIDVLKGSFRNYVEESNRADREIATLLVREWNCLKTFSEQTSSPALGPSAPIAPAQSSNYLTDNYKSQAPDSPSTSVGDASASSSSTQPPTYIFQQNSLPTQNNSMLSFDHGKVNSQGQSAATTLAPYASNLTSFGPLRGPSAFLPMIRSAVSQDRLS